MKRAVPHGTITGYNGHRCRCRSCRKAWRDYVRRRQAERRARPVPEYVHGTVNGYHNYGCRCRPCTDAATADTYARNARRAAGLTDARNERRDIAQQNGANAKLDPDKVRAIRASDEGSEELALRYGVSDTLIVKVRQKHLWRNIA